jgi:putative redox protein
MVRIDVRYEGELRCRAVHEPSGESLVTDAPVDNHGLGRSFSPTDLAATAMGTCMATTMAIAAQVRGIDLTGLTVSVEKEMTAVPTRRIRRLATVIALPRDPGEHQRGLLVKAALACPVHASLHPDVEKPITFRWGPG